MNGFATGIEHLCAEMQLLDLYLQRHVMRLRASHQFQEDEMRGLYITDDQINALLMQSNRRFMWIPEQETAEIQNITGIIRSLRQEIDVCVQASQDLPLVRLATLFDLTPFECQVLLISVMPELDLSYETLYAYAQNDVTKKHPGVDLTLKLLCQTFADYVVRLSIFAADAPLLRYQLLHLFDGTADCKATLPARFLKADQRIVDFLLERDSLDQRLETFTRRFIPTTQWSDLILSDTLQTTIRQITHFSKMGNVMVYLHGKAGTGKQTIVEAICTTLGRALLVVDARRMPQNDQARQDILTLLRREALLQGAVLYLAHSELWLSSEHELGTLLLDLLRNMPLPIFLGSEIAWHPAEEWPETHFIECTIAAPEQPQRLQLWRRALSTQKHSTIADEDVGMLANQFLLNGEQIRSAVRSAALSAVLSTIDQGAEERLRNQIVLSRDDLYIAARGQSRHNLGKLAQKVDCIYGWEDIVLPARALQELREVCNAVTYRQIVFSQWGFGRKLALGKGLNVLFSGTSGTGKTMAASIIAQTLRRDLYKIDLANVVSKYIGETEKNLNNIFQEAQTSNAVLFFDEADALFGKRSEVKDAHDRYANLEVAYLLQRMEEYTGIVILATNLSKNLDDAFARRMQHVIDFPFPDAASRELIWRKMLPDEAPLEQCIDFAFLGRQFELAGGNIRNSTLAGALMAAEQGSKISMEHLVIAIARELRKMGKLPSQTTFQAYYELVRQKI